MSDHKLRIIINTNAPWATSGYSMQAMELLPLIRDEKYPLACIDFYGLEGGILSIDGIVHYPRMNHVYGSDALIHHGKDFNADVAMTLQDTWVLNPEDLKKVNHFIPLVPIDHDPIPAAVLEKLRFAYRIVTYSQFGQKELERVGLHSTYIQHTVNTEIYHPMDKKELKRQAKLPDDCYILGMVAANKDNPPRKSFQEVMEAFQVFLQKYPNSFLYLHTNPDEPGGFPLKEYAKVLGITDKVLYPDPYAIRFKVKKEQMAQIYNTMDVLLMPSVSEGFGVPAIEAQACGVPVITNNFTSMPELVQNHLTGEVCDVMCKRFDFILSYVAIPNPKSIYDCLIKIKMSDYERRSQKAREWAVENYDTKKVFNTKWLPFLQQLENEIYPTT